MLPVCSEGGANMSRAFVKDGAENDGVDSLPDRPISDARNLVTARGLRLIEGNVARYREDASKATTAADRTAIARASRELRYWSARLASAEVAEPNPAIEQVVFGVAVTLRLSDGRTVTYHIVGEDEAEPERGRIAWTAQVAQMLLGAEVGEERQLPRGVAEVLVIEPRP